MPSLKLRSLSKRLADIESKIGPVDQEYPLIRAKFLAALAYDPIYTLVIAPEFQRAQVQLYAQRGVTMADITLDDRLWLLLEPEGQRIGSVIESTESYLDAVWENVERITT